MTFSTTADTVRSFCDDLTGKVLVDAVANFKGNLNDQFLSGKVKMMNGTIVMNHVNHLDNFNKLQQNNLVATENMKNSSKSGDFGSSSSEKENEKLGTIQEEANNRNSNDSSGDEVSSLTSDSDSDSDGSLSDSTEEEVEFFPTKRSSKQKLHDKTNEPNDAPETHDNYPDPGIQKTLDGIPGSPNNETPNTNENDVDVNNNDGGQSHQNTESPQQHKMPRKLSPLNTAAQNVNGHDDQRDGSIAQNGLQMIPTTSNDHGEQSTSGSSDIIIPTVHNREPPDLIKGNLNSSGTISEDSDLKDHARILAELQKIVEDDDGNKMNDSDTNDDGNRKDGGTFADKNEEVQNVPESSSKNSTLSKEVVVRKDDSSSQLNTNSTDHGILNGNHKLNGAKNHSNGTETGLHGKDGKEASGGTSKLQPHQSGTTTHTRSGTKSSYHENKQHSHDSMTNTQLVNDSARLNGTSPGHGNTIIENDHKDKGFGDGRFDGSQQTAATSSHTNLKAATNQTANFTNQEHLENLERKLSNLQISNTSQTEEIQRLKALNQSLKSKFENLERSSSHHQLIEEKMLQRNEELEKHLLGMLKSQEIIFEMKENLKATSADNEKLTKDYKDALKALEAVDKLFGQKDALVKKWKEATEESRQLVELLKKHNADVGDLETVDRLKDEIISLKDKASKAEEKQKRTEVKNGEVMQQSKAWKEKYERENEQSITLNFELQEVTKELKNQQKLAGKRGRKNQVLQLEVTELKDTLKLAKEKLAENDRRIKEMERKYADTQETYTKIIHEKEKQHSVLIKNSESYQKELVANIETAKSLRKEADSLKESIVALEKEKMDVAEKLKSNEKSLEETLNTKAELSAQLAKMQSDFEASKIEAVDNELFTEEQAVRLQELEDQCRQLQAVLKQYIHSSSSPRSRRPKTAPNRYSYGKRLRPTQTWPSHPSLDMYRQLLAPPRGAPTRRKSSELREARYRVQIRDKNDSEENFEDMAQKFEESKNSTLHSNRPKSTYGNRSLSGNNKEERHHDRAHSTRDWVPKIVLVDSQKLESGSEFDSGSGVSADHYAQQYVKLGDRVLIEMVVEGKKQNLPGLVKYVGPVYHSNFNSGIYAGLKLEIPVGDTNGIVGDRVYFRCLKKHGKFVKLSHILAVQNPRTQQYTRVLPMAYK